MSPVRRIRFYLGYATRSLRREGIRTFLAGLSVMFGVLSLVSMQVLSGTLLDGSMFDDRLGYGGDAQILSAAPGESLSESELAQIEAWRESGVISAVSPVSRNASLYLRTSESGRVRFVYNALGVDTAVYPLVGSWALSEPAGMSPAAALQNMNDALISRDIAGSLGLGIGDTFLLGGGENAPARLTVAGILNATPNQQGSSVYYTLETAQALENQPNPITSVSVLWGDVTGGAQEVIDSDLRVFIATTPEEVVEASSGVGLFDLMLKGAGVLGLLVGGLGVSNTLQVVLARRKLEIAMLKTLGWRRGMLFTLIGLETGLLGLFSSVIGAAAGVVLGGALLNMLGGAGAFLIEPKPDPSVLIGGVLAGSATAVVFGLQAILASSATRPIELLRDLPVKTPARVFVGRAGLFGVLIVVFGALVGIALGSVLEGIAYVLAGGLLLLVLRSIFWVVLWALLKVPLPRLQMVRLARANLKQRKGQASLIVIALFAGAFSVTFAAVMINNAQRISDAQRGSDEGYNLRIDTTPDREEEAIRLLVEQGSTETFVSDPTRLTSAFEVMDIEGAFPGTPNADGAAISVVGSIPVERLSAASDAVGNAMPDAFVFSKSDVNDLLAATYRSLFAFAVSVAGLAFVAGAILIANSAGLTVVERRREIGVFKAVGYTSAHVMRLLLSEYGFLGFLSAAFGIIGVIVAVFAINVAEPGANLTIAPLIVVFMTVLSVGIAVVSAALVVWQAARVRPLDVLRYE